MYQSFKQSGFESTATNRRILEETFKFGKKNIYSEEHNV